MLTANTRVEQSGPKRRMKDKARWAGSSRARRWANQVPMETREAVPDDLESYAALGRAAQAWLQSRGLRQYVPAAHEEYAGAIRSRIESGTLFAVQSGGETLAFFVLEPTPAAWWPPDEVSALYLGGIVVAQSARGLGVGGFIIRWSAEEAARQGCSAVRLDCHAENLWLCSYYESHEFVNVGRVEQNPGYDGCLYQLTVTPGAIRDGSSDFKFEVQHLAR